MRHEAKFSFYGMPIPSHLLKLLLVAALFLAVAAYGQDEQYRIRAKVDLVVVPVTVKGGGGDKLITNLKKEDFTLLEDGRQQTLTNFTTDPVPLSAAVVVDTGLGYDELAKVKKTFPALVGAFSPFDEVSIYKYDKFVTKVLDFSANAEIVQAALDKLRDIQARAMTTDPSVARGPFSIPGPVINGAPVVPPAAIGIINPVPPKPSYVLNDAIFLAASDLAKRERNRRKIVLVISDGQSAGNDHSFDETTKSLLEIGIEVYSVGLDQPFPYNVKSALDDYAKTTGGDAYFVNSIQSIERSYADATEEARNQYLLAYISNNEIQGESPVFRDIQIKIAGNNFKTLHRKGYYQYP